MTRQKIKITVAVLAVATVVPASDLRRPYMNGTAEITVDTVNQLESLANE